VSHAQHAPHQHSGKTSHANLPFPSTIEPNPIQHKLPRNPLAGLVSEKERLEGIYVVELMASFGGMFLSSDHTAAPREE